MNTADEVSSIVTWQPVLTDHQSHTLRALAHAAGATVTVVVAKDDDPERKAQGWTRADAGALDVRVLAAGSGVRAILGVLREHRRSIHLFSSPFEQPKFMLALFLATWQRLPVHLISEPYSPLALGYQSDAKRTLNGMKQRLRPWAYRLYGWWLKDRVRGVFAISQLSVAQYRSIGMAASKIQPFGYFVPEHVNSPSAAERPARTEACHGIFVGTLIARKGVAELVSAVGTLRNADGLNLVVDVYGAGDANAFAFDDCAVRHAGRIPFGHAQSVIARYDFLVLPSRYDGWGVVINEAVLAGVPVICSDRVGAGALVRRWGCGLVYAADALDGLVDALRTMATDAARRAQMRGACEAARHCLDPAVAGRYLAEVMEAAARGVPAPVNPWYDC
jgi:glycosyltransferase involved in cell wall biosynthesis